MKNLVKNSSGIKNRRNPLIIEILCGLLVVSVGLLGFVVSNLNKKIAVYEQWIDTFQSEVNQMYSRLKAVDDRNLFERDEDVGFVFSEVVRIAKEFNETTK